MTSAPSCASVRPPSGPATNEATSTTRSPSRGRVADSGACAGTVIRHRSSVVRCSCALSGPSQSHPGRGPGYEPGSSAGPDGAFDRDDGAMTQTMSYRQMGATDRGQAHTLFAQTMGYVAMTAALFALGAWAGHNLTGGGGIVAFILAFAALIAMRFTARRSVPATVALLAAVGLLIGLAVAPTVAYYGSMDPRALWQAGGATALFIAGFGAAGYATRRDLAPVARICFWALVALIVAGVVLTFVSIPGADLAYSALGLVIFAGFTMFDFQRLRRNTDTAVAPLLAASIFLDVLNVFLFFLDIFSGSER